MILRCSEVARVVERYSSGRGATRAHSAHRVAPGMTPNSLRWFSGRVSTSRAPAAASSECLGSCHATVTRGRCQGEVNPRVGDDVGATGEVDAVTGSTADQLRVELGVGGGGRSRPRSSRSCCAAAASRHGADRRFGFEVDHIVDLPRLDNRHGAWTVNGGPCLAAGFGAVPVSLLGQP